MTYRIVSALLSYPQEELLEALPDIRSALQSLPAAQDQLLPLVEFLEAHPLIALQENYVATFDRNPSHSLHLFEHVHGESRDRGQAMVDLLQTYRQYGLEPAVPELPDHVPLFLEFLSVLPAEQARELLDDAIHVLASIGARLARHGSPYAAVFDVLRNMTSVTPREHEAPPVRDMDEAMEVFGPGPDGVEPLLRPRLSEVQPLRFYRGGVPR